MRISSFVEKGSRFYKDHPRSKLLLVAALSGGGVLAYSKSNSTSHVTGNSESPKKRIVVLGSGWGATSCLKNLDLAKYDVQVVSPRNFFAFTPLLPNVTCGTVEARSIVEPIRNIIGRSGAFWEAECFKIDAKNKKIHCRPIQKSESIEKEEIIMDFDYLVVAVGARANTFNTPGVEKNCHFLKEVEDAQKIRRSVIDCFEKASLPNLSEDEKKKHLHFVVVGGGPTGVEFAAELHDFIKEDLSKLYPKVKDFVNITLLEAGDKILPMFDQRIIDFAKEKFKRDGIDLKLGSMVVEVTDKAICTKERSSGEVSAVPYGMVVWSTGIGPRPLVSEFMQQIGQTNRRVLATDEWLRVQGSDCIYALGDCASINQRRIMEDIAVIFSKADKDKSGKLTVKQFQSVIADICERYPQVELYMKNKKLKGISDLLKDSEGKDNNIELDIEKFKLALSQVDSEAKTLPATAQVASQQGLYLADCFNRMQERHENPEGPLRIRGDGRHRFHPFRYKHLGQFAPLGGEQTAAQLPGDWVSIGHSSQWLWYSVYASKQVSWRTRTMVVSDWMRRFIFGRDSSRI
ncbi:hypothetical protein MKW94_029805 [Papaver nudicaule]|uniref:NADH:ubiquinone reductase (non-electrogenic) n=1 Tax=Papaver nudicaule TaxID=74823 RepID=A0AA41V9H0_PAPNU|nr:hypothetical protein [Papaver nudicaule]